MAGLTTMKCKLPQYILGYIGIMDKKMEPIRVYIGISRSEVIRAYKGLSRMFMLFAQRPVQQTL